MCVRSGPEFIRSLHCDLQDVSLISVTFARNLAPRLILDIDNLISIVFNFTLAIHYSCVDLMSPLDYKVLYICDPPQTLTQAVTSIPVPSGLASRKLHRSASEIQIPRRYSQHSALTLLTYCYVLLLSILFLSEVMFLYFFVYGKTDQRVPHRLILWISESCV
jgi:hypothetical protein